MKQVLVDSSAIDEHRKKQPLFETSQVDRIKELTIYTTGFQNTFLKNMFSDITFSHN